MKTILKIILLLAITLTFFNCNNDDDNEPAPNADICNYQGLTANILGTQTLIPESQLTTDYFPNGLGVGSPQVEVYDNVNLGANFIITNALAVGVIDNSPQIVINGILYPGVVTCQRAGNLVGEELRFDIVLASGEEAELCVIIDNVSP